MIPSVREVWCHLRREMRGPWSPETVWSRQYGSWCLVCTKRDRVLKSGGGVTPSMVRVLCLFHREIDGSPKFGDRVVSLT